MIKDRNIDAMANINPSKIMGGAGVGNLSWLSSAPRPSADIQGKVYYVHPDYGSDSYDGLSPETPYKTILKARTVQAARISWAGSPWANQDMIKLFPGVYDETSLTAGLYGVNLVGLGNAFDINGEMGVTIKGASGSAWDAASFINGGIFNICFHAPTDAGTEALFQIDTFNRMVMEDCVFQGVPGASATTLIGLQTVVDVTGSQFRRLWFNQCATGMSFVVNNGASKQFTGCLLEDLYIMAATTAGIHLDSNCVPSGTVFNRFIIGPTPALGVDDDSATAMFCNGHVEATANDPATGSGHYSNVYLNGTLQA